MRNSLATGLVLCFCALAATSAGASVCEASYEVEGRKPTAWFSLGEVSGTKSRKNCEAMGKNDAANRKPAELGVLKPACDMIPVTVSIYTRLDGKAKREAAIGTIKTSLGLKCAAAPAPATAKAKAKDPATRK